LLPTVKKIFWKDITKHDCWISTFNTFLVIWPIKLILQCHDWNFKLFQKSCHLQDMFNQLKIVKESLFYNLSLWKCWPFKDSWISLSHRQPNSAYLRLRDIVNKVYTSPNNSAPQNYLSSLWKSCGKTIPWYFA